MPIQERPFHYIQDGKRCAITKDQTICERLFRENGDLYVESIDRKNKDGEPIITKQFVVSKALEASK